LYLQHGAKIQSMAENLKENENKRRQLEDQIDTLNEEVAKLRAQGWFPERILYNSISSVALTLVQSVFCIISLTLVQNVFCIISLTLVQNVFCIISLTLVQSVFCISLTLVQNVFCIISLTLVQNVLVRVSRIVDYLLTAESRC